MFGARNEVDGGGVGLALRNEGEGRVCGAGTGIGNLCNISSATPNSGRFRGRGKIWLTLARFGIELSSVSSGLVPLLGFQWSKGPHAARFRRKRTFKRGCPQFGWRGRRVFQSGMNGDTLSLEVPKECS